MRAKVATVEQAFSVGLDQQGIGIVGRVIDQIWSDAERPEINRVPVFETGAVE